MPPVPNRTRQLVDLALRDHPGGIEAFVRSRRDKGQPWRRIEEDLRNKHGVEVSYETLRSWFPELQKKAS